MIYTLIIHLIDAEEWKGEDDAHVNGELVVRESLAQHGGYSVSKCQSRNPTSSWGESMTLVKRPTAHNAEFNVGATNAHTTHPHTSDFDLYVCRMCEKVVGI